jgi:hypothetical protein
MCYGVLRSLCDHGDLRTRTDGTKQLPSCLRKATRQGEAALGDHVNTKTIESRRRQIMVEFKLRSVVEFTEYAVREGLTPPRTLSMRFFLAPHQVLQACRLGNGPLPSIGICRTIPMWARERWRRDPAEAPEKLTAPAPESAGGLFMTRTHA